MEPIVGLIAFLALIFLREGKFEPREKNDNGDYSS